VEIAVIRIKISNDVVQSRVIAADLQFFRAMPNFSYATASGARTNIPPHLPKRYPIVGRAEPQLRGQIGGKIIHLPFIQKGPK
jgi:hypothetical protein